MANASVNSIWFFVFNSVRLAVVFIGTVIISRTLGPAVFGEISYVFTFTLYLCAIDNLAHESVVKKYFSETPDKGLAIGSAVFLNFLLTCISVTLLIITAKIILKDDDKLFWGVVLTAPFHFVRIFYPLTQYFDLNLMAKKSSFALLMSSASSYVYRIIGAIYAPSVRQQSIGFSVHGFVYGVLSMFYFKRQFSDIRLRYKLSTALHIAQKSWAIFLSSLLFLSIPFIDNMFLKSYTNLETIGYFAMIVKLCEPWLFVSSTILVSFYSIVLTCHPSLVVKYFKRCTFVLVNIAAFIGVFYLIGADVIVHYLLGHEYAPIAVPLKLYVWAVVFLFLANILHIWETNHRVYHLVIKRSLLALVFKIGFNFLLIPRFGVYGIVVSTLISLSFFSVLSVFIFKELRDFKPVLCEAFKVVEYIKWIKWLKRKWKVLRKRIS